MKLFNIEQVPRDPEDIVFRYSIFSDAAFLIAFLMLAAASFWLGISGGIKTKWLGSFLMIPPVISYVIAGICLLLCLFVMTSLRKRLGPDNWLVRLKKDSIVIKFRSIMNEHFPRQDLVAVSIPYSELDWGRMCREQRLVRDLMEPETYREKLTLLELKVKSKVDVSALRKSLKAELVRRAPLVRTWHGKAGTKSHHHPVQIKEPDIIQVEWAVRPGIDKALDALRFHIPITFAVEEKKDFSALEGLSREDQETRIRELVERGKIVHAQQMVRALYGLKHSEAKRFIEELKGRAVSP